LRYSSAIVFFLANGGPAKTLRGVRSKTKRCHFRVCRI